MVTVLLMYLSCYVLCFLCVQSEIHPGKKVLQTLPVLDICAPHRVKVYDHPYIDPQAP